jgi:hypothetical protein
MPGLFSTLNAKGLQRVNKIWGRASARPTAGLHPCADASSVFRVRPLAARRFAPYPTAQVDTLERDAKKWIAAFRLNPALPIGIDHVL